MRPTIQAILARHNNNPIAAIVYCEDIAARYAHLTKEYWNLARWIERTK
jgi:hypothetical protein